VAAASNAYDQLMTGTEDETRSTSSLVLATLIGCETEEEEALMLNLSSCILLSCILLNTISIFSSSIPSITLFVPSVFGVLFSVSQCSALSPLLFVIVMEALSREFRDTLPWELLYAGDLVVMAETVGDLIERLNGWRDNMESGSMVANMNKTRIVVSRDGSAEGCKMAM